MLLQEREERWFERGCREGYQTKPEAVKYQLQLEGAQLGRREPRRAVRSDHQCVGDLIT